MLEQKKVAIFNDLSGFGRCSISVMLPLLSVMGHQGVAIPTAILSMHTEFPHYHLVDFTDELPAYLESFQKEGLCFDALCTGFLGNERQVQILKQYLKHADKQMKVIMDPVMGDHGRCYPTIEPAIIEKMKELVQEAHVLLPNLTELCLLCDQEYPEQMPDDAFLLDCCRQLEAKGPSQIVVTGMEQDGRMCTWVYGKGSVQKVWNRKIGNGRPGSGDVFAAVVSGSLLRGDSLVDSVQRAADFVGDSMELTLQMKTPHAYGLCFEPLLHRLMD